MPRIKVSGIDSCRVFILWYSTFSEYLIDRVKHRCQKENISQASSAECIDLTSHTTGVDASPLEDNSFLPEIVHVYCCVRLPGDFLVHVVALIVSGDNIYGVENWLDTGGNVEGV